MDLQRIFERRLRSPHTAFPEFYPQASNDYRGGNSKINSRRELDGVLFANINGVSKTVVDCIASVASDDGPIHFSKCEDNQMVCLHTQSILFSLQNMRI